MAKLRILKVGDDALRKVCRPVENITPRTIQLIDDMIETMRAAEGVGLAAPQVTYIMHDLKEKGFPVNTEVTTVEEAVGEIMAALEK